MTERERQIDRARQILSKLVLTLTDSGDKLRRQLQRRPFRAALSAFKYVAIGVCACVSACACLRVGAAMRVRVYVLLLFVFKCQARTMEKD